MTQIIPIAIFGATTNAIIGFAITGLPATYAALFDVFSTIKARNKNGCPRTNQPVAMSGLSIDAHGHDQVTRGDSLLSKPKVSKQEINPEPSSTQKQTVKNNEIVLRTNLGTRTLQTLIIFAMLLLQAGLVGSVNNQILNIAVIPPFVCSIAWGVINQRSGYLAISDSAVKIRNIRSRTFPLTFIESVSNEPRNFNGAGFNPVLLLKNGQKFRLTSFFMGEKAFNKSFPDNQITRVVNAINEAIARSAEPDTNIG